MPHTTTASLNPQRFLQSFFEHADVQADLEPQAIHDHHATLLALKTCDLFTLQRLLRALCMEYGEQFVYLVSLHGRITLKETQAVWRAMAGFDVAISHFHHSLDQGYAAEVLLGHRKRSAA